MCVKNKSSLSTLCDLYAWRKQFIRCAIGLLWIVVLAGCDAASKEGSNYEIINTGIKGNGCWYDASRFVVLKGEQPSGTQNFVADGIYYLDIANLSELKKIDLSPLEKSEQKQINRIYCQNSTILFYLLGLAEGTSRLYAFMIGGKPELISEMRGGLVNLKARYVIGNSRIVNKGVFEGNDNCKITYLKPGFKALCWNSWLERQWPLSNFVISEYRWDEQIQVKAEDGKPKYVPNPKQVLLNREGKPMPFAILLRDFANQIVINLSEDDVYGVPVQELNIFQTSPDESYAYSGCRKKGQKAGSGFDRVCRYRLDGNLHRWEEVFSFDEGHTDHLGIQSLNISGNGDVYFTLGGSKKFPGIWKYSAAARSVHQVTRPPYLQFDQAPQVSPDSTLVSFIRPDKDAYRLFIAQPKGARQ